MDLILVGLGGGIGAAARYSLGNYIKNRTRFNIPVNTMIINILGSFLLGISAVKMQDHHMIILFQTGVLGGFTTFSTFMVEGFNLFKEDRFKDFLKYMLPTVVLGALAFFAGACIMI